jgi:two-component system, sensor histidine kinase
MAAAAVPDPALSALPDEVQASFDHLPATLAGYAAGAVVLALLFWGGTHQGALLGWLATFAVLWCARLMLGRGFRAVAPASLADWARWRRRTTIAGLASGAMWGLSGVLFHTRGENIQQTGLILLVYAFCVAAMPVLATQPRVYLAYLVLTAGPLIVRIASDGDAYALQLAALLTLTVTMTAVLGGNYRRAMARIIDLRLRMGELLAQLRAEKESADVARREAEVANRAKTQFFAAASHDLRQPLHAMGLFAEALRQRTRDSEVAPLVNSINESVAALETLFSELLDITRLDSGHVEVNSRAFQLGDVLRRLRLHFEPEAFEKGLAFRTRGVAQVVHADPVIVERILRNLVSNAIRYTEDGSVLVGCRRRAEKVLLQVWDSGPGITPEQRSRVFEEFYQVPRDGAPVPGQPKGLGLGLSIVKRLADLIDAPLTLRSWPGRGSVFTLELAAAQAGAERAGVAVPAPASSLTLHGRRLIVVEDEAAVRAGIESMLVGWGAQLRSFDSVGACIAWVSRCGVEEPAPDLVLVDYRLEDGHNGIEALLALRRRFGRGVPAIMVTGSTMSRVELEAQEHQFHVLIKPVLPNKLRAMIGFKLAGRAAADVQADQK